MATSKKAPAKKAPVRNAPAKKAPAKKAAVLPTIPKADPEKILKNFPKLIPISDIDKEPVEEIQTFDTLQEMAQEKIEEPKKPLKIDVKDLPQAIKLAEALMESNRVINNFLKMLNLHDVRHEGHRQIAINNQLLK